MPSWSEQTALSLLHACSCCHRFRSWGEQLRVSVSFIVRALVREVMNADIQPAIFDTVEPALDIQTNSQTDTQTNIPTNTQTNIQIAGRKVKCTVACKPVAPPKAGGKQQKPKASELVPLASFAVVALRDAVFASWDEKTWLLRQVLWPTVV
jgi:hypothetical protein